MSRKGAKTGQSEEKQQKPTKRDDRGPSHRAREVARWGRATLARSCVPPVRRSLEFLFKPHSGIFAWGRSGLSLLIFRLCLRLVYQIKPQ